jgi:hypothetical protein
MVVKTQSDGREGLGLRVSAANVRRYFPRNMGSVELRLGDLQIQCQLPSKFWEGQPEIHDPRLCEWLKFKIVRAGQPANPITFNLVQSGAESFTVQPAVRRGVRFTPVA